MINSDLSEVLFQTFDNSMKKKLGAGQHLNSCGDFH